MCGRFSLDTPSPEIIAYFRLSRWLEYEKRYNIAPSQQIPVIRQVDGKRELTLMRRVWCRTGPRMRASATSCREQVGMKQPKRAVTQTRAANLTALFRVTFDPLSGF